MTNAKRPLCRVTAPCVSAFAALAAVSFASPAADTANKGSSESANNPITFSRDVARILQERCQECHRKGSMAPMSLVTYEETRPWAKAIRERVIARQMPPWHIDRTVGVRKFKNDMSLSDEQISAIVRWVDVGAPMGNVQDMPAARQGPAG